MVEYVTRRESKYTNFLGWTKFTKPPKNNNFIFQLSCAKVVHRETAANVCASLRTTYKLAPRETVRIAFPCPEMETKTIL